MSVTSFKSKVRSSGLFIWLVIPMIIVFVLGAIALQQMVPAWLENNTGAASATEQYIAAYKTVGNRVAMIVLAMAIVSLLLTAWAFRSKIAGPLATAAKDAKHISEGDLEVDGESFTNDDVGLLRQSLKGMKLKLADVISGIREGAHGVSDSAEQVSQGNLNLSQRTQEQASSLEEVASTMEQMTEAVNHNAENAARAKELAVSTNETARKSLVVVSSTIGAMATIEKSNKKIADIISVIQNIAFQTNLLALNAAVEAARAGEQGRGFAVVASEVRDLAGRSAKAAKEIKELIDDSVSNVEAGSNLIDETGEALSEIATAVENVTAMIAEIAAASREQSVGITQVNKAILQMDEMTQSNASLVEEAAAASEALGAQAEELASLVSFFKLKNSTKRVTHSVHDSRAKIREIEKPSPRTALPKQQQQAIDEDDEWKDF
jgi:methyl-accepting chemotaxis protein